MKIVMVGGDAKQCLSLVCRLIRLFFLFFDIVKLLLRLRLEPLQKRGTVGECLEPQVYDNERERHYKRDQDPPPVRYREKQPIRTEEDGA